MARRTRVRIDGLNEVLRELGRQGAAELLKDLDGIVEKNALKIANEAKVNAPRDKGPLKNSIHLWGRPAKLKRTIGSDRPYAQRQEYEHKTQKGFFRKAMWNGREPFRKEIQDRIKDLGG
ncbi:MAG: HK97 gp10 family phage protein [Bacillota bacterium]